MIKYKTGYGIERKDKKLIRKARNIGDCALITHDLQTLALLNLEAKNAHKSKKSSVNFYDSRVKNQVKTLRNHVTSYNAYSRTFKSARKK